LEGCEIPLFFHDILYADFRQYEAGFISLARTLGIERPSLITVHLRDDIKELLSEIEQATSELRKSRFPSPSHELFDVWSPLEDKLLRLSALEFSLGKPKSLERKNWELPNFSDKHGRPTLDNEPFPRNMFLYRLASVVQQVVQLAARYGYHSGISQNFDELFRWLGGTPPSN
jgi:hypothetical protein